MERNKSSKSNALKWIVSIALILMCATLVLSIVTKGFSSFDKDDVSDDTPSASTLLEYGDKISFFNGIEGEKLHINKEQTALNSFDEYLSERLSDNDDEDYLCFALFSSAPVTENVTEEFFDEEDMVMLYVEVDEDGGYSISYMGTYFEPGDLFEKSTETSDFSACVKENGEICLDEVVGTGSSTNKTPLYYVDRQYVQSIEVFQNNWIDLEIVNLLFSTGANNDTPIADVEDKPVYYTVTFDSNGGDEVASQQVLAGGHPTKPVSPEKATWTFLWWECNGEKVDFDTFVVDSDVTFVAQWA